MEYLPHSTNPKDTRPMNYTAQINAHGNVIVCKGDTVRNSYRIAFTGSYQACLQFKLARMVG